MCECVFVCVCVCMYAPVQLLSGRTRIWTWDFDFRTYAVTIVQHFLYIFIGSCLEVLWKILIYFTKQSKPRDMWEPAHLVSQYLTYGSKWSFLFKFESQEKSSYCWVAGHAAVSKQWWAYHFQRWFWRSGNCELSRYPTWCLP